MIKSNSYRRILVTGATGFIGRALCLELAKQGNVVHALCRNPQHPFLIKHPLIIPFKGDITDQQSLLNACKGCGQIYHTAALAKMWNRDKNKFYTVNVEGTRNVLEAARISNAEKIVHTSSCGVIGPTIKYPMNENDPRIMGYPIHYERTKYLAEILIQQYVKKGINIVIVNPSRVYGEGPVTDSNTTGKMITQYLKGKWHIIPGNGEQVANYVYLEDVVNGHFAAMQNGIAGERYILGGEDISFNQFFNQLQSISDKPCKLYNIPQKIIQFYSRLEQLKTTLTGLPPNFLPEFADRLNYDQKYISDKAVEHLGYTITSFDEGLRKTIRYYQSLN
jgi:nucleoside-diphosphate-sugar epimerase